MNRDETAKIMSLLETAYPQFYSKQGAEERLNAVNLWAMLFAEESYSMVEAAAMALIKTRESDFPPSIGELNAEILRVSKPQEMTPLEAWALVERAAANAAYDSEREFNRLPDTVRRLVGSPNQLREWSMIDSNTFNSVIASNFQRSYRARVESDKAYASLPASTKAYIAELGDALSLELPEQTAQSPVSALKAWE